MCLFRAPSFALCVCAHSLPVLLVSFAMAPKRRTEEAHPRGAHIPMHSPPDQRAAGSPQALTPLAGLDVELPRSPVRAAAARHSQEATQPAPSSPSLMQQDTPPRVSQRQTLPMELTPTPTKDKGTTSKSSTRHSQEYTTPAPPQHAEIYDQQRERHNQEEELRPSHWLTSNRLEMAYPQLPVWTTNHRCWSLRHRLSTSKLGNAAWLTSSRLLN